MVTRDTQPVTTLKQGDTATAKVLLNDGRTMQLNVAVAAPRPRVALIGKGMQLAGSSSDEQHRARERGRVAAGREADLLGACANAGYFRTRRGDRSGDGR